MLMLDKAHEVFRCDLANIPTPRSTETWRPVSHINAVDTLLNRANARGLRIRNERYAVMDGVFYSGPGCKTPMPDARMFGSIDFDLFPGIPFPVGVTPSVGIRNSHDKSFSLSILAGARVLVCANGMLSAEHVISRKHTSGLNLKAEIDRALDAFLDGLKDFSDIHNRLKATRISLNKARSLAVRMAEEGAIASSKIIPVVKEFETPSHGEFKDRNAWHLYQAATETMKCQSPARQVVGFKSLNRVLLGQLN